MALTEEEKEKIREENRIKKEQEKAKKVTEGNQGSEETVVVKKGVLDQILSDMDDLKKNNAMLLYAADKSRLAKYNDQLGVAITHTYRLRTYKGQLVIGWSKLIEDVVEKIGNGIWTESQIIEVYTEDGGAYKMKYTDFNKMQHVKAEVMEKTNRRLTEEERDTLGGAEGEDKTFFTLKVVTAGPFKGKELKVADNFVNR